MLETLRKNESFEYQKLSPEEMASRGILGRLVGPCADFINPTRNGRGYNESLWDKTFEDPIVKEKIENKCLFGELGHPVDREEVDMEKIALALNEMPKKGKDGKLIACFDILDTPNGRILKTLCDYGTTIGISSRGSGDVVEDDDGNSIVDPDTYCFECFDAVIVPAVKDARLQYVTESYDKNTANMKKALCESLENASEEDRKVMKETLENLHIDVEDEKEKECINESCADKTTGTLEISNTTIASNAGTEELVNNMTKILKEKLDADNTIKELQEKLAVSDAEVNRLKETLNRNRSSIVRLTAIAKESKKDSEQVAKLQEELESNKTKISELEKELESKNTQELNESVKLRQLSSAKTKTIKDLQESIEKQKHY